jgi:phage N-6-adenine-methyltransferase
MGMTQPEAAEVLGVRQGTVSKDLSGKQYSQEYPEPDDEPLTFEDEPADYSQEYPEPEPEPAPKPQGAHVGKNAGDNEWYTPSTFIKAAAAVMGGIDLDPASSDAANVIVGAAEFYTEDDDGLTQPWAGRIWMNPPYAQPLVDRFCTRLAREHREGHVTEACVLVNNATETNWFQEVLTAASAVCFPRGRVKFWHPAKESIPLQGQAVIYLGPHVAEFKAEFLRFGPVGAF